MATLKTTTLNKEDFCGINLWALETNLVNKCIEKIQAGCEIEGDILHEFSNELHYVYFTSTLINPTMKMHRYHKAVFSMLLFDMYYYDSNVIDATANYTLQDVKNSFKGLLQHLTNLTNI